jgi:preprotein translocase subunit Sec63
MPSASPILNDTTKDEKYQIVEEIMSASDYYKVLGIKKDGSTEEIRRAYIKVK